MTIPKDFNYLEHFDSTILQEPLFATNYNLLGRPLKGYEAQKIVVSNALGQALVKAQKIANDKNLTLKIYDSYRPLRAVEDIVVWANDVSDQTMKNEFYAHIDKQDLFKLGYVLLRSFHCTGAAVDLTLVSLDDIKEQEDFIKGSELFDGILPYGERRFDNGLDMGTNVDTFHDKSHTLNPEINPEAKKNRALLCEIMDAAGFDNYEKEWWHFNLKDKPFNDTYFDFVIR